MAKKTKIMYKGMVFDLRESALRKTTYGGQPTTPYINVGNVEAGSMVKQYIKHKYPKLKVWVKADSGTIYSSTHVNVANADGTKVDGALINEFKQFADSLRSGQFNGMTDNFDYRSDNPTTDNGTRIDMNCTYISIDNYVPYGKKL